MSHLLQIFHRRTALLSINPMCSKQESSVAVFSTATGLWESESFCVSSCMLRGRLASQSVSTLAKTWWVPLVPGGWHFTQWPWMSRPQTICQRLAFQLSVDVSRIHKVSCTLCQDAGVCIIKIKWVDIGKCGEERSSLGSLFFSNLEVVLLLLGSQTLFWYSEVLISYFWKEQDTLIHIQTDFKCNRVSWMATFYGPSLCPMLTVALAKGEGPIPNATFDNHPKSFNGPFWPTPSFLYVC